MIELKIGTRTALRLSPAWSLPAWAAGEALLTLAADAGAWPTIRLRGPGIDADGLRPEELGPLLEAVVGPTQATVEAEAHGETGAARVVLLPAASFAVHVHSALSLAPLISTDDDTAVELAARCRTRAKKAEAQVEALFAILSIERDIAWEPPSVFQDSKVPGGWQRLRTSTELFSSSRGGSGNCLDLTVLFAAVLERLGIPPVVLIGRDDPPHAWIGFWLDGGRRFTPLPDPADLRAEWRQGRLGVVECTAVCVGEERRDFDTAVAEGGARLETMADLEALEVAACRPPHGAIPSLAPTADPLVQRARAEALRAGEQKHALRRETLHILLGLCLAGGPLTADVFGRSGLAVAELARLIRRTLPEEGASGPPAATANWTLCWETARVHARSRGSRIVHEGDLLWAVLENPSRNVGRMIRAAGSDLAELASLLEDAWPRPQERTVSRRPGGGKT